ncbi:hypothetical protein [Citrobacter amalonaticus]|uniref:hypothetical protein n=1 Tax=Citrobacter amalonaticus TaxID=35703 RepID=UPI001A273ED9|nr:hypothetical protein [Citrobacter amalonaticus]HDQ2813315.1 hypothetical protein [Citrobacter amalonaticus]
MTRFWQKVPVTTWEEKDNKINIRLQDIPTMQAEIYRVSDLPPSSGAPGSWCGNPVDPTDAGQV